MSGPAHYRFSIFEACADSGELRRQGLRVKLHSKPALLALLERPSEIVSRDDLQRRLWPGHTFVEYDNCLNNAIGRLRQALRDTAYAPRFVETVPGRGYRFIAPVEAHTCAAAVKMRQGGRRARIAAAGGLG